MMNTIINVLLKLNENDKRIIIAVFLILILSLLILGMIYDLVRRWMRDLGKRVDTSMNLIFNKGYIKSKKQFSKIANAKSNRLFFKNLNIGFLLIIILVLIHVGYFLFLKYVANANITFFNFYSYLFEHERYGFGTILPIFDLNSAPKSNFFGLTIISDWPPLIDGPHFELYAIGSYIIVPFYIVIFFYLLTIFLAYGSRKLRIHQLKKIVFSADLSDKRIFDLESAVNNEEKKPTNVPVTVGQSSVESEVNKPA